MKSINHMDFEGYLEDATRITPDGLVYLEGKRSKFLLRMMHDIQQHQNEKIEELIQEANYQRNRRIEIEQVLTDSGMVLPPPVITNAPK